MKEKWDYPDQEKNNLRFEQKHKQYVLQNVRNLKDTNTQNEPNRLGRFATRISFTGVAIAALVFLLIGSTYVSPAMAKVVSTIPYLSQFIKQEEHKVELFDTVYNVIRENEYKLGDIQIKNNKIIVSIAGTKEEVSNTEDEVISNLNTALQSKDLGKFEIQVKDVKEQPAYLYKPRPEEIENEKKAEELKAKITVLLEELNYELAFPLEVRFTDNFMYVSVFKTEKGTKELKARLKEISAEHGEFRMRITQIDRKAREQEIRMGGIVQTIGIGLMENKDFKVTGFSFSFHPYPLQFTLKTSIKSSDPDAKEYVERIEKEINDFIKLDERTKDVRNEEYELTILSKDKKKLN
ncbi:DUF4030 domain-containing protein [Bacillus luteolus]|uniref:DUF4030 domain-containing protein n=1 Tax=Litchfieldia luteola TaxID=682179 RepID=A0ABR9QGK5_9BACI|nr:DUF4030 domain-containing protein [Cytobacillus luteolus]MBE4907603.1 DUF4030 domain-containing protein [Cytobacillus luteolus]MBP1944378.1 hypothetical protein [Cytobacillus luteolus]